jgi:hypothetical protein
MMASGRTRKPTTTTPTKRILVFALLHLLLMRTHARA